MYQQVILALLISLMMNLSAMTIQTAPGRLDIVGQIMEGAQPTEPVESSKNITAENIEEHAPAIQEEARKVIREHSREDAGEDVRDDARNEVPGEDAREEAQEKDAREAAQGEDDGEEGFTEVFRVDPIDAQTRSLINGFSWKEGCPVPIDDLRLITVTCVDFEQKPFLGQLIMHKKLADEILEIFREIYDERFPIERMVLVDEYDADDTLSMEDNNSSAFNYRVVDGSTSLSKHAYGFAVDINPVQNPYIIKKRGYISPSGGRAYTDRADLRPGMIVEGNVVHRAFKSRGWTWGGDWVNQIDYQHFQKEVN